MKNFTGRFSRKARLPSSTIIFHFLSKNLLYFLKAFIPHINYSWSSAFPSVLSLSSIHLLSSVSQVLSYLPNITSIPTLLQLTIFFSPITQRIFDNKETVLISAISLTTYYPRFYRLFATLCRMYSLSYFLRFMSFTSKFSLKNLSYLLTPHIYPNIFICETLLSRHTDLT